MTNGLVSVAVPVYNAESSLDRCVESLLRQTYDRIEILLVDDGSTDSSPLKCDQWKARDPRIRVFHKQNAGAGMARNTGIDNARGQFLLFLDSDDLLADHAVEILVQTADSTGAELVLFGCGDINSAGETVRTVLPGTEKAFYSGREVQELFLPAVFGRGKQPMQMISTWSYLYSMDLIRRTGWRSVSEREIYSEDSYSLLALAGNVAGAAVIDSALTFHSVDNARSITHQLRADGFYGILRMVHGEYQMIRDFAYPPIMNGLVARFAVSCLIGELKKNAASDAKLTDRLKYFRQVVNSPDLPRLLREEDRTDNSLSRTVFCAVLERKLGLAAFLLARLKGK